MASISPGSACSERRSIAGPSGEPGGFAGAQPAGGLVEEGFGFSGGHVGAVDVDVPAESGDLAGEMFGGEADLAEDVPVTPGVVLPCGRVDLSLRSDGDPAGAR
jgi:hypothetical protein